MGKKLVLIAVLLLIAIEMCHAQSLGMTPWQFIGNHQWASTVVDNQRGNTAITLTVGTTYSVLRMERTCAGDAKKKENILWNVTEAGGVQTDCKGVLREWNIPVVQYLLISSLPEGLQEKVQKQTTTKQGGSPRSNEIVPKKRRLSSPIAHAMGLFK